MILPITACDHGDGREEVLLVWNDRESRRVRVIVVRLPGLESGP